MTEIRAIYAIGAMCAMICVMSLVQFGMIRSHSLVEDMRYETLSAQQQQLGDGILRIGFAVDSLGREMKRNTATVSGLNNNIERAGRVNSGANPPNGRHNAPLPDSLPQNRAYFTERPK